jgi:hypothetical protein
MESDIQSRYCSKFERKSLGGCHLAQQRFKSNFHGVEMGESKYYHKLEDVYRVAAAIISARDDLVISSQI